MNREFILYSRTLNRDYRWIFSGKSLLESERGLLCEIKSCFRASDFHEAVAPIAFGLNTSRGTVFCILRVLPMQDHVGRSIVSLEGIHLTGAGRRDFTGGLEHNLLALQQFEAYDLDDLDAGNATQEPLNLSPGPRGHDGALQSSGVIEHNGIGLQELRNVMLRRDKYSFFFGASTRLTQSTTLAGKFDIVVPIQGRCSIAEEMPAAQDLFCQTNQAAVKFSSQPANSRTSTDCNSPSEAQLILEGNRVFACLLPSRQPITAAIQLDGDVTLPSACKWVHQRLVESGWQALQGGSPSVNSRYLLPVIVDPVTPQNKQFIVANAEASFMRPRIEFYLSDYDESGTLLFAIAARESESRRILEPMAPSLTSSIDELSARIETELGKKGLATYGWYGVKWWQLLVGPIQSREKNS